MFREILTRIVDETQGGLGAVLMGYDGIAVDQYFASEESLDVQTVAVEYASVLKEIQKTADILNLGAMEEVAIRTDRLIILLRMLKDDYFVALLLDRNGNFGRARYLLRRERYPLIEALG
jgi:predicted regulator of Ras-like GTPase activity (Roadblock/LC7/MglB family)